MRVDELKIKRLIADYLKNNENENILFDIIKELSEMVYNYPRIVFRKDLDTCSDFYIYFISDIKKIILKYNSQLANFNTYLNIALKSRYINWYNKTISKQQLNEVPLENLNNENIPSLEDKITYNIYINKQYDNINSELKSLINSILKKLPQKEMLIVKLLFYPIDSETLKILSAHLNTSLKMTYKKYMATYHKHNLIEKQNELREKIYKTENRIYALKNKIDKLKKQNKSYKSVANFKQRLESILSNQRLKLYKNNYVMSFKGIEELLKISKSEIYTKYKKLNQKLQQELSQYAI